MYCGSTANTNGAFSAQGGLTGARAAKFLREQAAHVRNGPHVHWNSSGTPFELGESAPSGWAKSGSGSVFGSNGGGPSTQSANCTGWTESTSPGPSGYLYMGGFFELPEGNCSTCRQLLQLQQLPDHLLRLNSWGIQCAFAPR